MESMQAAVVNELGAPLSVQDTPTPHPGPGEALMRLVTSGVCEFCRTGWETLCEQEQNGGYTVNGSFMDELPAGQVDGRAVLQY